MYNEYLRGIFKVILSMDVCKDTSLCAQFHINSFVISPKKFLKSQQTTKLELDIQSNLSKFCEEQ